MSPGQTALSIVIPYLNEEDNIIPLYEEICAVMSDMKIGHEIIFVDDGSTDSSNQKVETLAAADEKVKLIVFGRNFGQTAAMSAGIDFAQGEVIMLMDADRQNDPADIPKLYEKILEGHDVVVGWRKNRQDKTVNRKLPSRIANWLIRKVGGVQVNDLGCSHKAFRREIIKNVKLYGEMHRFIPLYTATVGGKLTEVVVNHRARVAGVTKYGIARTFKVILDLITVKFLMNYATRPMYFFGGCGLFFFMMSFVTAFFLIIHKVIDDISIIRSPLLIVTAVFILLAFNFVLMGLLAEILMRIYYESQNKTSYFVKRKVNVND